MKKPFRINIDGEEYNCFCQGYSIALTKEDTGELGLYDGTDTLQAERFFNGTITDYSGTYTFNADVNAAIKELKNRGYRWSNRGKEEYYVKVLDDYYKAALFEVTYNIINDGKEAIVDYKVTTGKNPYGVLYLKSKIGECMILPIRRESPGELEERCTPEHIIEL